MTHLERNNSYLNRKTTIIYCMYRKAASGTPIHCSEISFSAPIKFDAKLFYINRKTFHK